MSVVNATSRPLYPRERDPFYRKLGGPQGCSGRERKISSSPRFDPATVQPVASTEYYGVIGLRSVRMAGHVAHIGRGEVHSCRWVVIIRMDFKSLLGGRGLD